MKVHWHAGNCYECGDGMRCATEVLQHHRACQKDRNALVSSLRSEVKFFRSELGQIKQLLGKNSEETVPLAEGPSAANEESAAVVNSNVFIVKQEIILEPAENINVSIDNDIIVKQEINHDCSF